MEVTIEYDSHKRKIVNKKYKDDFLLFDYQIIKLVTLFLINIIYYYGFSAVCEVIIINSNIIVLSHPIKMFLDYNLSLF